MKFNKKKTNCMILDRKSEKTNISIISEVLEHVEKFKYMGSIVNK